MSTNPTEPTEFTLVPCEKNVCPTGLMVTGFKYTAASGVMTFDVLATRRLPVVDFKTLQLSCRIHASELNKQPVFLSVEPKLGDAIEQFIYFPGEVDAVVINFFHAPNGEPVRFMSRCYSSITAPAWLTFGDYRINLDDPTVSAEEQKVEHEEEEHSI